MKVDKNEPYNNEVSFEAAMLSPRYFLTWLGMGLLYLISLLPIQLQLFQYADHVLDSAQERHNQGN